MHSRMILDAFGSLQRQQHDHDMSMHDRQTRGKGHAGIEFIKCNPPCCTLTRCGALTHHVNTRISTLTPVGGKGGLTLRPFIHLSVSAHFRRDKEIGRVYLHLVQSDIAFRSICCRIMYTPCRVQRTLCYSISGNRWCGWQIAVE